MDCLGDDWTAEGGRSTSSGGASVIRPDVGGSSGAGAPEECPRDD